MKNTQLYINYNCQLTIPAILLFLFLGSCTSRDKDIINSQTGSSMSDENEGYIKGKSAPRWAEMLKHNAGWLGADGIYAVALRRVEMLGKADSTETFFGLVIRS